MIIKKTFNDFDAPKQYRRKTIVVLDETIIFNSAIVERTANGSLKIIFHTYDEFGLTNTVIEVVIEREDFEEIEKLKTMGVI